ncbi:MAG: CRISPR-associated endonuclease Cas3'', partial [Nevskia sp.]|uniref:CRISPR-associated endonuclease Cas3'' n=1 Tax=Nevskia sp. TaxID=1929292 RepID=UPI004035E9A3
VLTIDMNVVDARYWGKAAGFADQGPDYHLLAFHCLDVAAVGAALLKRQPRLRSLFAELLGIEEGHAVAWLTYLLSLHDLGKFAEAFQGQKPELFERLNRRPTTRTYSVRHDSLGNGLWIAALMADVVNQDLGLSRHWKYFFAPLIRAVTGHHGQPPQPVSHVGGMRKKLGRVKPRRPGDFGTAPDCGSRAIA